ncbi:MAG TPA: class I SAM-dependent methyltransferase, partial [Polyangiales bacterium]|nr:class I SAM-dependent methyltransferase [Polyangiales bacterium]
MDRPQAHSARLAGNFDRVASRYDLLNRMNPGYRRHLRISAQRLELAPHARVLDLCCGTGLSTEALLGVYPSAQITALDNSRGMLDVARGKPALAATRFLLGDAMDPAAAGASGPFDALFMAYGIRNVSDPDACLLRMRGLLRGGGRVVFHEYSVADNLRARLVWNTVATAVIIPLGATLTRSTELFRYLRSSVNAFDSVERFCLRLRDAGFQRVAVAPMDGWQRGIAHTFSA